MSVIVVATPNRGRDSIWETLDSFPRNSSVSHEVIVADSGDESRRKKYESGYPWVRLVWGERAWTVPTGRNAALATTGGGLIAFCDDHIRFPADYLEALMVGFKPEVEVLGGAVANGNPITTGSWAHYFAEYSKWLPGTPHPDLNDVAGANWAIRRELLDELAGFAEGEFGFETDLVGKLKGQGRRVEHAPGWRIGHIHETRIVDFWPISFEYGRAYAKSRADGLLRRLLVVVGAPALALLLLARSFEKARHRREYWQPFLMCLPKLGATFLVRAFGEASGHLAAIRAR